MDNLKVIGVLVSVIYLFIVGTLSITSKDAFANLDPNMWGDFLAGAFGPLALFWLVLGFFQQGSELRNSAEALRIQAAELRNSVEAQKSLVKSSDRQIEQEISMRKADLWLEIKRLEAEIEKKLTTVEIKIQNSFSSKKAKNRLTHDIAVELNKLRSDCESIQIDFSNSHPIGELVEGDFDERVAARAYNWNARLDMILEKIF
jgi:hypothetical protein